MSEANVLNEFRQDLVSGEWVLFATGRTKRPHTDKKETIGDEKYRSKDNCPFEDFKKSGNEPVWFHPSENDWRIAVIKNKFPAVKRGVCKSADKFGLFNIQEAVGIHDLFVYKDHDRNFADLSREELVEVMRVYKRRYGEVAEQEGCIKYILIFHNYGKDAGASVYHPHSQLISLPILPPDVHRSISGSEKFYKENGKNVYDVIVQWELDSGSRIVYENERFVVLCPFVSKTPYEIRIFMKKGDPYFNRLSDDFDDELADALSVVLKKIKKALNDPSFNMFIHTAPVEPTHTHDFYNWHIEILPKVKIAAGFEMGTGVDINVVDPDQAAKLLRDTQV